MDLATSSPKSSECTILAVAQFRIDGGSEEELFECEMDPIDMNGVSGLSLPIQATAAQKKELKQLLENGEIVSGKSSDDNGIFLPPGLNIAASISNEKAFGRTSLSLLVINPFLLSRSMAKLVVRAPL